jgi:site-specific recombinase XerD
MKKNSIHDRLVFWDTAKEFLYHQLIDIRKVSDNTISSYRDGLNQFIDYLENEKKIRRRDISFSDFDRETLKNYQDWMLNNRKLSGKTCNLRLTAIRSLLEYASGEHPDLMSFYLGSCSIKGTKIEAKPIEFFENKQMKALLLAPDTKSKIGRRNQMMLILMYDTAARVTEIIDLTLESLHLNSDIPYITIFGKGRKYRNVPLMEKTCSHLKRYLREFHEGVDKEQSLFYAVTHGTKHQLSDDTLELLIKKYTNECVSKDMEMPVKPHCHMIRKTRAMDLYQNGIPLTHIQQLLGHEDLSTTSGFYAFATLDTLAKSLAKVNPESSSVDKKWANKETMSKIYRL